MAAARESSSPFIGLIGTLDEDELLRERVIHPVRHHRCYIMLQKHHQKVWMPALGAGLYVFSFLMFKSTDFSFQDDLGVSPLVVLAFVICSTIALAIFAKAKAKAKAAKAADDSSNED